MQPFMSMGKAVLGKAGFYGPTERDDLIDAITVVQTYIKEQNSSYEEFENHNTYRKSNDPSERNLLKLKAKQRFLLF